MSVLDASAILAFLHDEPGADLVEAALESGAISGSANWSEVAQKVLAHGRDWDLARAFLQSFGLRIEPVTVDDAEWAAARWRPAEGLSLGDRLCLATGARLDVEVLTADRAWEHEPKVRLIR